MAQVKIQGKFKSKSFPTKAEAEKWAVNIVKQPLDSGRTFRDLMARYLAEVTAHKKTRSHETKMIARILRDDLAEVRLIDLAPAHIAAWRDRRLREVSANSMRREMAPISHATRIARKEWGWLDRDVTGDVRRPPQDPPRDRVLSPEEIDLICYVLRDNLDTKIGRLAQAIRFAGETGMRQAEISRLEWRDITGRVALVRESKTRAGTNRQVPLSLEAVAILERMKGRESTTVFDLDPATMGAMFRYAKRKSGVAEVTFHDLRHTAITKLAKKLSVMELAKAVGIIDLKTLQTVYYNPDMQDIAAKLD